jgi:DHA2 family multidrug resistance protein
MATNPWLVTFAVTLATFMEVLDTSVANVALPNIAGSLSATVQDSTWVLTSYLVSNAIVLPLNGWITGIIGRKNFNLLCVAAFTLSSLLCGLAPNLPVLILFRIIQGLGGGGLQPSAQGVMNDAFPPEKRSMGMAVYGITVVVAPILGPVLGGWLTDHFSWRWIFFINVPIGLIAFSLTSTLVSDPPYMKRRKFSEVHFDYIGMALLVLGIGALQIMLDTGQRNDWFNSDLIRAYIVTAVLALAVLVTWTLMHKDPIIDFRLLANRGFATATWAMFMLGFSLFASTVMLPLFLQTMMGYTATESGMALSPGGLVTLALMPVVGAVMGRLRPPPAPLVVTGMTIVVISLLMMTRFGPETDYAQAVSTRLVLGIALPLLFLPINAAAFGSVTREQTSSASGLVNLARNLGGSIGVAFVTTFLDRSTQAHQADLAGHLTALHGAVTTNLANTAHNLVNHGVSPADAPAIANVILGNQLNRQAHFQSYVECFTAVAFLLAISIPFMFMLRRPKTAVSPGAGH